MKYIGIDLGTSSLKGIITDNNGSIIREANEDYSIIYPQDGWTEQNPDDWTNALLAVLKKLVKGFENEIAGISFGGQMHGLVVLDKNDQIIRPCILWNDARTEKQTEFLNTVVGKDKLSSLTGNIAFAGFTAPKILWLYHNERENFDRITKIMLPKDYLCYFLSGSFCSDFSDASGTLLLDVKNRRWSKEMCEICHININQLPALFESYEVVGKLKEEIRKKLKISTDVKIVIGAGDNAAAAIGTGTVSNGNCNISIGTSGTLFISQDKFSVDENNALHSFAHANGKWHLMGCILSAASCRKWWIKNILKEPNYDEDEKDCDGEISNVIFLPYLSGERSPHNDINAFGTFVGLRHNTTKGQMSRAIMEGVAFAILDCLNVAKQNGLEISKATICGGGAKSKTWIQIFADILNLPVSTLQTEQGPSYGACILAMVGCGEYPSVEFATSKIIKNNLCFYPIKENADKYSKKYIKYKKLYPLLKELYLGD